MAEKRRMDDLVIEGARLIFRNFSGKADQYNREGDRNFNVVIDNEEFAQRLIKEGWNIKVRLPKEDGEEVMYRLPVKVNFSSDYPPTIWKVNAGNNLVMITEDIVGRLDRANIRNVDLIISPYFWEVNGKSGVKAYLKTMYITLEENVLEEKYAHRDDSDEIPFN